jgi:predicted aspartyl protease
MADKVFTTKFKRKTNVLYCHVYVSASSLTVTRPTSKQYLAIWDTGATNTVITSQVANDLDLKPIGRTRVKTASGTADCNVYLTDIILPNKIIIQNVRVTEGVLADFDVLIGMDIIGLGDFAVSSDPKTQATVVSYRIPTSGIVDFVKSEQAKRQLKNTSKKLQHKKERQNKKKARKSKK